MKALLAGAAGVLAVAAAPSPSANGEVGARAFAQCVACHAIQPGRNTPAGPTLHNVIGRPVSSLPGFNYSPALRRFAAANPTWTPALLDRFIADPEAMIPGTEMGYGGMRDPAQRRALVDWLSAPARRD